MIRPHDWSLIGLTAQPATTDRDRGPRVAKSFGELADLFPRSTAHPASSLTLGLTCPLHGGAGRNLLSTFRKRHPGVDLVIEDVDESNLDAGLENETLDLVIAPAGAAQSRWSAMPLWRERMIVALPESHALAAMGQVAPADLRHEAILLAGHKSGDRALQKAIGRALGGRPTGMIHQQVQRDTLFDMVALGFGVTIGCPVTLGGPLPGVCLRPIGGDGAHIAYDLFWNPANVSEGVQRFVNVVRDSEPAGGEDHADQF